MLQRILVPLDGSARAERALPVAARIARSTNGSLVFYRAVPIPSTYGAMYAGVSLSQTIIDDDTAAAKTYLEELKQVELLRGIPVECAVEVGVPAGLILEQAEGQKVDLIVLCSHGRTGLGRWVLGSVAEHISRQASVPVLVLSEHGTLPLDSPDPEHLLRVLVPLDGAQMSEAALEPAALLALALASPYPAGLHLTLVVNPLDAIVRESVPEALVIDAAKGYLIRMTERLRGTYPTLTITWSVGVNTDVTSGILHVAECGEDAEGAAPFGGCDLIVMATHGRSGFRRWALGSIAERVLHSTKLPVMMVRPRQSQAQADAKEGNATTEAHNATSVSTFTALL